MFVSLSLTGLEGDLDPGGNLASPLRYRLACYHGIVAAYGKQPEVD